MNRDPIKLKKYRLVFPARSKHTVIGIVALVFVSISLLTVSSPALQFQDKKIVSKLQGFDAYMKKILRDWNAPGIGVGIVSGDKLIFAKGYGYRDYVKKLPLTPTTLFQIASNTKLFTAIAAGMLVEEGKLTWDKPIRDSVPSICFYNDQLNNTVTLRDMLSHRTGITRHDSIWYQSNDTRKQLFDKVKFLEPQEPLRTTYLYNNLMFSAVGHIIELQSGMVWEEFVRERIFKLLEMTSTVYSISDMLKQPDFGVTFTEKRDSFDIYKIPYYEDTAGIAPCGAIISNIQDLSRWLIALMNDGQFQGKPVLPLRVLKSTMEPGIALPNTVAETRGYWELLNEAVGMGRITGSYRGHLLTYHGGDLPGFHSQISFMPRERIGAIVFVIGDHCASLYDTVSYNIYERLLGMNLTPWSNRLLSIRLKGKKARMEARAKAGADRVPNTRPSHPIPDYAGEYSHPAYGILKIERLGEGLQMDFHKIRLPLSHFHYDRFETPDDETYGRTSINFVTNPQGDVDKAVISLDEAEVTFTRKPVTLDPKILAQMAGTYETATGFRFQVVLKEDKSLYLAMPGESDTELIHYKDQMFRIKLFSDIVFEFVLENGQVKALKQRSPSGEFVFTKK